MKKRKEYDSIGVINVPGDKYWGASTQRSKKYFDIGKFLVRHELIKSIAIIKKSAAIVHRNDKQIEPRIANAIVKAANEVIQEKLNDHHLLHSKYFYYILLNSLTIYSVLNLYLDTHQLKYT